MVRPAYRAQTVSFEQEIYIGVRAVRQPSQSLFTGSGGSYRPWRERCAHLTRAAPSVAVRGWPRPFAIRQGFASYSAAFCSGSSSLPTFIEDEGTEAADLKEARTLALEAAAEMIEKGEAEIAD